MKLGVGSFIVFLKDSLAFLLLNVLLFQSVLQSFESRILDVFLGLNSLFDELRLGQTIRYLLVLLELLQTEVHLLYACFGLLSIDLHLLERLNIVLVVHKQPDKA